MAEQPDLPESPLRPDSPLSSPTVSPMIVHHSPRPLHLYLVREDDLDILSQPFGSVAFGLATTFFGLFFGLLIAFLTANLTDRAFGAFVGAIVATGGLCLLASFYAIRDWRKARARVRDIRRHEGSHDIVAG
jgi:hypothetical protein